MSRDPSGLQASAAQLPTPPADLSVVGIGVYLADLATRTATARGLDVDELDAVLLSALAHHAVFANRSPDVLAHQLTQWIAAVRAHVRSGAN